MKEGPVRTTMVQALKCSMVTNASKSTCEAKKGCAYSDVGRWLGGFISPPFFSRVFLISLRNATQQRQRLFILLHVCVCVQAYSTHSQAGVFVVKFSPLRHDHRYVNVYTLQRHVRLHP
jgi:hypothetical protein